MVHPAYARDHKPSIRVLRAQGCLESRVCTVPAHYAGSMRLAALWITRDVPLITKVHCPDTVAAPPVAGVAEILRLLVDDVTRWNRRIWRECVRRKNTRDALRTL